ncbi:DUF3592 domain-containing protein [Microbulbifer aestuariivivens]
MFFFAGAFFLTIFTGKPLLEWMQMQGWQPMQAQIIEAELQSDRSDDGSRLYSVSGSYRYRFDGREYSGNRVSLHTGSDNIGSYQRDLYRRLDRAQGRFFPGWVNPDNPAESVLDRDLRWRLVLFPGLVSSVFILLGAGVWYLTWRRQPVLDQSLLDRTPWLARSEWSVEGIYSNSRATLAICWFVALVVSAIGLPMLAASLVILENREYLFFAAILIVLLIAMGSSWYRAIHKTIEHRRFGPVPVVLDPFPGQIGGRVAGYLPFPRRFGLADRFELILQQMHTRTRRNHKGSDVSETDCLWELKSRGRLRNIPGGSRLYFAFAVPEDMKSSRIEDGDGYWWSLKVRCRMQGVDFDREYEIPVFRVPGVEVKPERAAARPKHGRASFEKAEDARGGASMRTAPAPSRSSPQFSRSAANANPAPLVKGQVDFTKEIEQFLDIKQRAGELVVSQAPGKQKLAKPLMVYALLFLAIGIGVAFTDAPLLFPLAFSAFGFLLLIMGVLMLTTGYETSIGRDRVVHRILRFGKERKRLSWPRSQIRGLGLELGASSSGGKRVEYFNLVLQHRNGEKIKICSGLEGKQAAAQLQQDLGMLTSLKSVDTYAG